jgi:hypothetical protein|tara:strand:+ start:89 stop:253 length:165 start_codon:yes stop_codon:yes gene_type:complete
MNTIIQQAIRKYLDDGQYTRGVSPNLTSKDVQQELANEITAAIKAYMGSPRHLR